ncbi:D-2-hydroxyacid dehydrogenase [Alkalicoccus halolimnae]|uniref:D-2-hydroxyacid dehydrogenase n=1 Tax=Alkalicoccus halolimnae TaxID=1667239 RepID=A0A5C7FG12_9BACI|nr:D-2-hydroxyacid dehydrogenase [Alkalicoccus halolimnae]TXF85194.1 D-2-hydroxyacid dehydrogenase [Alkalicoccus halolimnae]
MVIVSSANILQEIQSDFISKYPDLDFRFCNDISEAERELSEAEILITLGEDLVPEHINMAKNLKWIMVISAGMDKMPFEAIAERNIFVTNAKGIHAVPMAEYTIHMMLHTARQATVVLEQERQRVWDRSPVMMELHSKTVCIVGAGAIGTEIARLAAAFRMKTVGVNQSGRNIDYFDEIFPVKELRSALQHADFVISVLPKTPETDDLFSGEAFKAMDKHAVFINIGRGNVVNEKALIDALDKNELHEAVLDVFKEEPLPSSHAFWSHPKITVTPHLSGISPQYQPRAFKMFSSNLNVYLSGEGEYINPVDTVKGY